MSGRIDQLPGLLICVSGLTAIFARYRYFMRGPGEPMFKTWTVPVWRERDRYRSIGFPLVIAAAVVGTAGVVWKLVAWLT